MSTDTGTTTPAADDDEQGPAAATAPPPYGEDDHRTPERRAVDHAYRNIEQRPSGPLTLRDRIPDRLVGLARLGLTALVTAALDVLSYVVAPAAGVYWIAAEQMHTPPAQAQSAAILAGVIGLATGLVAHLLRSTPRAVVAVLAADGVTGADLYAALDIAAEHGAVALFDAAPAALNGEHRERVARSAIERADRVAVLIPRTGEVDDRTRRLVRYALRHGVTFRVHSPRMGGRS